MKGPFALRLIAATVIVVAIYGAMYGLKAGIKTPEVIFPVWCHKDNDPKQELCINLPLQLGAWSGTKIALDPAIFNATGAKIAEDRNYSDDSGHTVSLHIAYYDDAEAGVWHSPTSCYRCQGWQCQEEARIPLAGEGSSAPQLYFTRWDKEGTQCLVAHWFDLGGRIFYDRGGLGKARIAMWGQQTWPPLVKVLIQNRSNAVTDEDQEILLNFSKQVYLWLNDPSHRSGDPPGTSAKPAPEKTPGAAKSKIPAKAK